MLMLSGVDLDRSYETIGLMPHEIDGEKPIGKIGRADLDSVCQHEGAMKLPGGYAAMEVIPGGIVCLLSADRELTVLELDLETVTSKPRNGLRYRPQIATGSGLSAFDVVGRITVACGLADPIDQPFYFIETEQKWARQE